MDKVISKTIKIMSQEMPPRVDFIEKEIIKNGLEPLRWAIVDVENNMLTLNISGRIINNVD